MKMYTTWMWGQLMIHACFWRSIFFAWAFPHTHKFLIENISSKLLSTETITLAISTIVITSLFNKYSEKIFEHFKLYCVVECLLFAIILPAVGTGLITPSNYFIVNITIAPVVGRMINCSATRLRRMVYDREMRERYDNCHQIALAAAGIIGGVLGMIEIPLWVAWSLVAVGVVIDDVFYWIIYNQVTKE